MDQLYRRLARAGASFSLAVASLSLIGCNPDPTDPENLDAITLVNNTSSKVQVFWCASDGGNACSGEDSLGLIPAGANRQVHISSYEVLLHIKPATGPEGFVCEDNAPGNHIALNASYPSMKSAYDNCTDGHPVN